MQSPSAAQPPHGDPSYEELRVAFTAAVSHELRTPLARLVALLDSADLPGADPAALLAEARAEVEEMRELVDDVLFLAELESGREVVALGPTRARPILEEVLDAFADSAERAGVSLELEVADDVQLPLRARMLRLVAQNLTANAIRYAGEGATFRLAAGDDADATILSARDDGIGVSEDERARLFERFFRGDRARSSRGTGLGLAIVKHIVNSAGGTVEARRPDGAGLEVRCTFPR